MVKFLKEHSSRLLAFIVWSIVFTLQLVMCIGYGIEGQDYTAFFWWFGEFVFVAFIIVGIILNNKKMVLGALTVLIGYCTIYTGSYIGDIRYISYAFEDGAITGFYWLYNIIYGVLVSAGGVAYILAKFFFKDEKKKNFVAGIAFWSFAAAIVVVFRMQTIELMEYDPEWFEALYNWGEIFTMVGFLVTGGIAESLSDKGLVD